MKKIYVVLLCLGFLSCKEEEEVHPLEFPATYISSSIESRGQIRVFSRHGEVTDPKVVSSFVRRHGDSFLHENGYRQKAPADKPDSLRLVSLAEVRYKYFNDMTWKEMALRKNGQQLEIQAKDTVFWIGQLNNKRQDEYIFKISRTFIKHPYAYFEPINYGYNVGYVCKILLQKVGYIENDVLRFPRLNYVLVQYWEDFSGKLRYRGSYKRSGLDNVLQDTPDVSQLDMHDSIAFQAFDHFWEKR